MAGARERRGVNGRSSPHLQDGRGGDRSARHRRREEERWWWGDAKAGEVGCRWPGTVWRRPAVVGRWRRAVKGKRGRRFSYLTRGRQRAQSLASGRVRWIFLSHAVQHLGRIFYDRSRSVPFVWQPNMQQMRTEPLHSAPLPNQTDPKERTIFTGVQEN